MIYSRLVLKSSEALWSGDPLGTQNTESLFRPKVEVTESQLLKLGEQQRPQVTVKRKYSLPPQLIPSTTLLTFHLLY